MYKHNMVVNVFINSGEGGGGGSLLYNHHQLSAYRFVTWSDYIPTDTADNNGSAEWWS